MLGNMIVIAELAEPKGLEYRPLLAVEFGDGVDGTVAIDFVRVETYVEKLKGLRDRELAFELVA